ncbi:hypothetical protein [Kitasatospora sp. NPDC051914]|uniref:hypothetical protein n=1 Tax=Kitasatospora sp. NPDC051914 TaxID=3154945 RepID=UPI0034180727
MIVIGFAILQVLSFGAVAAAPVRHPIGPRAQYVKRWGFSVSLTGLVSFVAALALYRTGFQMLLWVSLVFFWMGTIILMFSKWWSVAE